jgi:hypothetical protein
MFEQQNQSKGTDSPDRGRTPTGSSNGDNNDNGRKLSKIRSSFVTVQPSAALARATSSVRSTSQDGSSLGGPPFEASISNRDRRESFSMDTKEDAAQIEQMHQTVSQEEDRRRRSDDVKEIVPEVAIWTGPAGTPAFGTPKLAAVGKVEMWKKDAVSSAFKRENVKSSGSEGSTTGASKDYASSPPTSDAPSPPAEVLQNLANQLRTPSRPSQTKMNGKAPAVELAPARAEQIAPLEQTAGAEKETEISTPASTASRNGKVVTEIVTSTGDLQTSPGGVSPTVARHPLILPESPTEQPLAEQSTSMPAPAIVPKPIATPNKRKQPAATSRPKPSTPAVHKSPRPSRSTPNFKGGAHDINGHRPKSDRKPTVPIPPKFSAPPREKREDRASKRPSAASSVMSNATERGIGFVKPRPKSPTRPLNLPSHLLAPTASSAAKLQGTSGNATTANARLSPAPSRSRRPSTMSERGTKPTITRKASVRPPKASAVGPPPAKKREHDAAKRESVRAPDEGFLARMMRPTASSASKVRENAEELRKSVAGGACASTSASGKGKAREREREKEIEQVQVPLETTAEGDGEVEAVEGEGSNEEPVLS